jgi:hypothetical protein
MFTSLMLLEPFAQRGSDGTHNRIDGRGEIRRKSIHSDTVFLEEEEQRFGPRTSLAGVVCLRLAF